MASLSRGPAAFAQRRHSGSMRTLLQQAFARPHPCFLLALSAVTPGVNTARPTTTHCPMLPGPRPPAHSPSPQCHPPNPPTQLHAPRPPPRLQALHHNRPLRHGIQGRATQGHGHGGHAKGTGYPRQVPGGSDFFWGGGPCFGEAQLKCVKRTLVRITPHFQLQHAPTTLASQVHEGQPGLQKSTQAHFLTALLGPVPLLQVHEGQPGLQKGMQAQPVTTGLPTQHGHQEVLSLEDYWGGGKLQGRVRTCFFVTI